MAAWRRWQDYATIAFGVLLLISPFVFGQTSHQVAAVSAYVLGILLVAGGVVASATGEPRRSLVLNAPGIAAVITFIAALVLAFTGATAIAWTAGVMAIATVLVGATLRLAGANRMKDG